MTLGDRVKRRRERLGLTQDELAQKARVRRPTISELENHRRQTVSSDVLKRLALALGCTADYLLGMYVDEDDDQGDCEPADVAVVGASVHAGSVVCSRKSTRRSIA